ncbi:MAG: hypothetical protein IPO78_01625 [Saprospiraceae bacterium]|nr:hypothetical protein [Saprospiraceae bacterium]MBK9720300.1 hypothetical protein [Saprospiraceae bacterium]
MKKKVLITDDVHPLLIKGLIDRNWIVDFEPEISLQETFDKISNYEGLVINSKIVVDRAFLKRAQSLLWIGRLGSGMEIIDIPAALERGIHLINTPEANCNAVAEHALGMLFSLFRNLNRADYEVRRLLWEREKNRGEELAGKVIGVLGYGHTGARFIELLEGLSVKVLVYDKYKQLSKQLNRYTHVVDADEIRKSANVISLHLPLTTETKNLLDRDFIAGCKNPFYLINTSRGQVVNTIDLIHALHIGKVKGACLDVFENEKPASFTETERAMYEELYRLPQVILSPHIAGWTYQSKQKIGEILLEKLDRVLPRL